MLSAARINFAYAVGFIAITALSGCISGKESIELETRPGVTVRFETFIPEKPVASLLILRGTFGHIVDYKYYPYSAVDDFVDTGIEVGVMGAPSNRKGLNHPPRAKQRMLRIGDRVTDAHKTDLKKTIANLKQKSGMPVWVLGMSTGSISAAFAARSSGDRRSSGDSILN
ncbi:MAG: hypothetical protein QF830_09765 [Rhodospirillales bacterium]|jgi:hypothetical protein|nr:hypothetical protein [Rhodospirillales bacterium]MDP6884413.1 hypothetical protein [Rhodospirillales bacterium]